MKIYIVSQTSAADPHRPVIEVFAQVQNAIDTYVLWMSMYHDLEPGSVQFEVDDIVDMVPVQVDVDVRPYLVQSNSDPKKFWSNSQGWVEDVADATKFTENESRNLHPPMDGHWGLHRRASKS